MTAEAVLRVVVIDGVEWVYRRATGWTVTDGPS